MDCSEREQGRMDVDEASVCVCVCVCVWVGGWVGVRKGGREGGRRGKDVLCVCAKYSEIHLGSPNLAAITEINVMFDAIYIGSEKLAA